MDSMTFELGRKGLYFSREYLTEWHRRQMDAWPEAAAAFHALGEVRTRAVDVDGFTFTLQHNPARVRSTAARVDAASLAMRSCFLCGCNRKPEQTSQRFDVGREFELLVNPFPIFPLHFTLPSVRHEPQSITAKGSPTIVEMLLMARRMPGMAVFYNGPHCGASAPDHMHFQAVEAERLPLVRAVEDNPQSVPFEVRYIMSDNASDALAEFASIVAELAGRPENKGEDEPRMNIIATYADGEYRAIVIPRRAHRPDFYGTGEGEHLLSPASVDFGGVLVLPSE
ncbi:MAG: DUF4922 domain-containing protein, partial [Muribaculaceae bacterium]|nr:DUF4922 domain-containing protein [Muribaculaceae bacterium]